PGEVGRLVFVHKDLDVRANSLLLIDDPEAEARIAAVDLGKQFAKSRTIRFDHRLLSRVRPERRWHVNLHELSLQLRNFNRIDFRKLIRHSRPPLTSTPADPDRTPCRA